MNTLTLDMEPVAVEVMISNDEIGVDIEWPDLDEHIGVEGLLLGRASGESKQSLKCWLASRPVYA